MQGKTDHSSLQPTANSTRPAALRVVDLGRMSYAEAYALQLAHHVEVLASRGTDTPEAGRVLLVEHDPPVITVSRRPEARLHLTATAEQLSRAGVEVAETDRGGDITYHGPGQLVVYPILDLNFYHLGLHAYMRLLEQAIIDAIGVWGVVGERDSGATGVWVGKKASGQEGIEASSEDSGRKIAALGVRVRRWVSMHGLALNVSTNLEHFDLIVPCGLAGRGVTSLEKELGERCPAMSDVKARLTSSLAARLAQARAAAPDTSDAAGSGKRCGE